MSIHRILQHAPASHSIAEVLLKYLSHEGETEILSQRCHHNRICNNSLQHDHTATPHITSLALPFAVIVEAATCRFTNGAPPRCHANEMLRAKPHYRPTSPFPLPAVPISSLFFPFFVVFVSLCLKIFR
jgi:hypothetical protein